MSSHLQLSFELDGLDPESAEAAAVACGASAVTFVDARDSAVRHPTRSALTLGASSEALDEMPQAAVLEPAPGEVRLWGTTRVQCLFAAPEDPVALGRMLAAALGIEVAAIEVTEIAERAWEREWLKSFHAMRFGERLWVCPHHERVEEPGAVVVQLDPGLAFGTGTHASTALCLEWLDRHLKDPAVAAEDARVIDYGCGSGVLALAAVKLGVREVHCFDIDPQALIATRDNAEANGIASRVHVHAGAATLPGSAGLLLANILASTLCALAGRFAALLRPGGAVVLAGLMAHEVDEVTEAYAACFDVAPFGEREGWVALAGRRRQDRRHQGAS